MELNDLTKRFTYVAPKPDQPEIYQKIRGKALDLAVFIDSYAPDSRELSIAITKLEEVVMWANAAIARGEEPEPEQPQVIEHRSWNDLPRG